MTKIALHYYRNMKHSKDTSGFSNSSWLVIGHCCSPLSSSVSSSSFRTFSVPTRLGDLPVFLDLWIRPALGLTDPDSTRIIGDLDLLTEISSLLSFLPDPIRARPGDGSDRRYRDLPADLSLLYSPGYDWFPTLAGDLFFLPVATSFSLQ